MTVKELREYIAHLPDEMFEYDGPETYKEIVADGFIIAEDDSTILLVRGEN